jgi:nucleoside 2-deoxyribosyltransferase
MYKYEDHNDLFPAQSSSFRNRLRYSQCYLAGSIDMCPDGGKTWRNEITPHLKRIGIKVFNPLEKPLDIGLESDDNRSTRRGLKLTGKFDEFSKIMRTIRHADLRMVDKSDFLIVYLDMSVLFCGTMEEIVVCNHTKKPILVFCKQGKTSIPDWIWGMIPHKMLFNSIDEVLGYIKYVDSSEVVEDLGRWIFFNDI